MGQLAVGVIFMASLVQPPPLPTRLARRASVAQCFAGERLPDSSSEWEIGEWEREIFRVGWRRATVNRGPAASLDGDTTPVPSSGQECVILDLSSCINQETGLRGSGTAIQRPSFGLILLALSAVVFSFMARLLWVASIGAAKLTLGNAQKTLQRSAVAVLRKRPRVAFMTAPPKDKGSAIDDEEDEDTRI